MRVNVQLVLLAATAAWLPSLQCYNMLLLAPFNGPSHWLFLSHYISALDARGHSVTAITAIPYAGQHPPKYTEILIEPPFDLELTSKDRAAARRMTEMTLAPFAVCR